MKSTKRNEQPELITIPKAAQRVGVGIRQIRRACFLGLIPIYRIGGWDRVRWSDVDSWIESQRDDPRRPKRFYPGIN